MDKEYINIQEGATLLGISKKLMTKLTHQEGFPCIRFPRRVVICRCDLVEWFRNNSNLFVK